MKNGIGHATESVRFTYRAAPGTHVSLVGSFNRWNPIRTPLEGPDESGLYSVTVPLSEGSHEYLFVVNGVWLPDPVNPHRVENPYGSSNSVVDVRVGRDPRREDKG